MFKAHVEKPWNRDEVEIYLMEKNHRSSGVTYFAVKDGNLMGTTVTEGAPLEEPLLRLPLEAVEALASALCNVLPPTQATSIHLEDSIKTRDRLLVILEGLCWPRGEVGKP